MRKGSLDIGLNFTIIIILGVVIMGLAMWFVLYVFKYADEKMPQSAPEIIFHANADNQVYPEGREIKIHPGDSDELLVSIYNPGDWSSEDDISLGFESCSSEEGIPESGLVLESITQKIEREKDKGYSTIIKVGKDVLPERYVCTLMAGIMGENGFVDSSLPFKSRQVSINVV
jgi:hypothetical protein